MTPDQLRALADALERMAQLERYGSPGALALESATAYLRAQADAPPVAWVDVADSYEGPYIFSGKELLPAGRHDLYTHPAPAAPQAEPASIGKPGFVQQIETTRESIKAWPQWMQDASVETGATMPTQQAEPKVAASFYTEDAELIGTTGAPIKKVEVEDDGSIHVFIDHWPQPEQPIDLDTVAMQQMRQAAAESTWMPAEYSGSDWISDVCRWLRDGPPQPEPKRPAFLDEIDRAKEHVASWPQWMKDATVSAAATLPVTEPKREALRGLAPTHRCPACGAFWRQCDDASWNLRSASCCGLCDAGRVELVCWLDEPKREPLSDWRIGELHRQWLANPETVTIADLMRAVERAHGIGGSDAE